MPPLGMHAYRLFSNENRQEVQSALKFDGKPAAMSDVAKVLGQKWRELSDESKKARTCTPGARCLHRLLFSSLTTTLAHAHALHRHSGVPGPSRRSGASLRVLASQTVR